jgi:hypothetical protein
MSRQPHFGRAIGAVIATDVKRAIRHPRFAVFFTPVRINEVDTYLSTMNPKNVKTSQGQTNFWFHN